jgi:hypothetical protein
MPKQVQVSLGGRDYTVTEKPMGANGVWRQKLRTSRVMRIFESLDEAMIQLVSVADGVSEKGWDAINLNQVIGISRLLPVLVDGLTNSVDEIIDLLFDYEPKLRTERGWLEENAYDDEVIRAFVEVLKLCFPIMGVLDLVRGSRAPQTQSNSHAQNGASGLPPTGPKKKASISS